MESRCVALLVALPGLLIACSARPDAPLPAPVAHEAASAAGGELPPTWRDRAPRGPAGEAERASLEVLKQALASRDWEDRLIAVESIGEGGRPELAALLDPDALGDPEQDIRLAAVEALSKLCARRLLRSVRDDTTERLSIRALAAGALLAPCLDPLDPDGERP